MASTRGSITLPLVIVIFAVCFGSNFQFYSNSVVNNLAIICQDWINQSYYMHYGTYITDYDTMNLLWSFTSAALQIGCLMGALFTGYLADKFGRRKALIISSTMSIIGATLEAFSKIASSFEMLILGRCFLGLALGSGSALASIFIVEIAPVQYRGACGSTQQMMVGFGNLLSLTLTLHQVFGIQDLWPIAVSLPPFLASLTQLIVLLFFAYDSPRYLVLEKKNLEKGLAALIFYQGQKEAETRLKAIERETNAIEEQENKKGKTEQFRFLDLFRNAETRRPLFISLTIILGVQMSGVSAILSYSKIMFVRAGLDDQTAQRVSVGLGVCNFLSPVLGMFLVERTGRKVILLIGLCLCDAMLISLSICVYGSSVNWSGASTATVPCLYLYQIGFGLTNSVGLLIPAELFAQKVRASAMTVVFCFTWCLQIVCVLGYLPFSKLVGISLSYVPFISAVSTSIVLLGIFLPETKSKTVEEVAALFASKAIHDVSKQKNDAIFMKF